MNNGLHGARVASAGSGCARRVAAALRHEGCNYLVTESAHPIVPAVVANACQYGVYSARHGEVTTARQLLQLLRRATGRFVPQDRLWQQRGRWIDPFRPTIQPAGYASARECEADRVQHLDAVRRAFRAMDVFVFTLASNTLWAARSDGAAYPLKPSLAGGPSSVDAIVYCQQDAGDIGSDIRAFVSELETVNANARIMITVSSPSPARGGSARRRDPDELHQMLCSAAEGVADLSQVTYLPGDEATISRQLVDLLRPRRPIGGLTADPQAAAGEDDTASLEDEWCDDRHPSETVKCVVWDLDNTLWDGVLTEQDDVAVRAPVLDVIQALEQRGIVSSIASRGDRTLALAKLTELGISDHFVVPQIGWDSKASSIDRITEWLNISPDAVAFVDDQEFERAAVAHAMPRVMCIDAAEVPTLLSLPRLTPAIVTDDARLRRRRYLTEAQRREARTAFRGTDGEFLRSLDMHLTIAPASRGDIPRLHELIRRTHRLNSTGRQYTSDQLAMLLESATRRLLVASLSDRFGTYGTIAGSIIACGDDAWTVELLLMSCRVMARGVEHALLYHVMRMAQPHVPRIRAEFVSTGLNAVLNETFREAGFRAVSSSGDTALLERDLRELPLPPAFVHVESSHELAYQE